MLAQMLSAALPQSLLEAIQETLRAQIAAAKRLLALAEKLEFRGDLKEARQALTAVLRLKLPTPSPAPAPRHTGESSDRLGVHTAPAPARSQDSAAQPASSRACPAPAAPPLTHARHNSVRALLQRMGTPVPT